METINKILVATDYSANAESAELYAAALAQALHCSLVFSHIYKHSEDRMYEGIPVSYHRLKQETLETHVRNTLKNDYLDLSYNCLVREGSPPEEILHCSKEEHASLIVNGKRGMNSNHIKLWGNTTWGLISRSRVPVLIIPEGAVFNGIRKIIFYTDYRSGEIPVLKYLSAFAALLDAELIVAHIVDHETLSSQDHAAHDTFRTAMEKEHIVIHTSHYRLLPLKKIPKGAAFYASEEGADVIVLAPQKRSFWEKVYDTGTAPQIIMQSEIPVLTIPDYYDPDRVSFWSSIMMTMKDIEEQLHL